MTFKVMRRKALEELKKARKVYCAKRADYLYAVRKAQIKEAKERVENLRNEIVELHRQIAEWKNFIDGVTFEPPGWLKSSKEDVDRTEEYDTMIALLEMSEAEEVAVQQSFKQLPYLISSTQGRKVK